MENTTSHRVRTEQCFASPPSTRNQSPNSVKSPNMLNLNNFLWSLLFISADNFFTFWYFMKSRITWIFFNIFWRWHLLNVSWSVHHFRVRSLCMSFTREIILCFQHFSWCHHISNKLNQDCWYFRILSSFALKLWRNSCSLLWHTVILAK